jgi:hypothetical protein
VVPLLPKKYMQVKTSEKIAAKKGNKHATVNTVVAFIKIILYASLYYLKAP